MINARIGRSPAAARINAAGRAFEERKPVQAPHPEEEATPAKGKAPPDDGRYHGACQTIIEEVAAKYRLSPSDILSDRRSRAVLVPARHEAIYRCVLETPMSLPAIGRVFKRDHTSIGHAVMRHHFRTNAPLPRGMVWVTGWKVRHPKTGEARTPPLPQRNKGNRLNTLQQARIALDIEIAALENVIAQEPAPNATEQAADASGGEGGETPSRGNDSEADRANLGHEPENG
jgi:hypothetical protein